jgi:hypothetical protein
MCTERDADTVMVCDVAIGDVRAALAGLPATFMHVDYEGTLVVSSDPAARGEFRRRVNAALAPHGGRLDGSG